MNITLEEQIEYIRGEVESYVPGSWTRVRLESVLATLEASRDDEQEAKRYRFLKSKMTVPYAMQSFIRHNNWHPECMHLGFEETIDAAMAMQTKA